MGDNMPSKKVTKRVSTKKKTVNKKLTEVKSWSCTCCGTANKTKFYQSVSEVHKHIEVFPTCKECMNKQLDNLLSLYDDNKFAFYLFCRKFDIVFSTGAFDGAIKQAAKQQGNILGSYMSKINSFRDANGYGSGFADSEEFLDRIVYTSDSEELLNEIEALKEFKKSHDGKTGSVVSCDKYVVDGLDHTQSKKDVIGILGYDPFINEPSEERPSMYTMLIDYLDENTQDDNFKVPICVQIVKSFNQANRIDKVLATMDVITDVAGMKKMFDTKGNILKSTLKMAEDNAISSNHSNNKSKGAGTLGGILKQLQEKDLRSSDVNLFDIGTC